MKNLIPFLLIVILFSTCTKNQKKVMLVFSYHPEYEWVEEETQGVMDAFSGEEVVFEKFYMDTKRHTDAQWMKEISAKAIAKVDAFQPDVLMVFDDNACRYVAEHYNGSALNMVFCGMNGAPADYGFPSDNITGVVERELWNESYHLVKQLVPKISDPVILLDSSATAAMTAKRIETSPHMKKFKAVYRINTFEDWKETILMLQDSADAIGLFVYFSLKDDKGNPVPPEDVISWTLKNNSLPEFAILDFTVKNGALCGVIETGHTQGRLAAELALRILNGESPGDIEVITHHQGQKLINQKRAQELGITIDDSLLDYRM